jgi:hypothetical protein
MEVQEQAETTKMSQKNAVYNFVNEALENVVLAEGQKLKELVTKEIRKIVRQKLFAAVKSGQVKLSKQYNDSRLKKYCSGLINNWLGKDIRFN